MARKAVRITRDAVLFYAGLAGVIYETLNRGIERPALLLVFAGMMGMPQIIKRDEAKDESKDA